jgi:hypothetical protein
VPLRSSDVADIGGADWGSLVRVKSPRAATSPALDPNIPPGGRRRRCDYGFYAVGRSPSPTHSEALGRRGSRSPYLFSPTSPLVNSARVLVVDVPDPSGAHSLQRARVLRHRPVSVRVYPERIVVAGEGQVICEHRRVFARSHQRKSTTTVFDCRFRRSRPGITG